METGAALSERDWQFALAQYGLFAGRVTELQREREAWVRHSILATFAFFGWLAVYRDDLGMTFMLDRLELQAVLFVPLVFNAGGAVRFFFLQRDINRTVTFLAEMERGTLGLAPAICDAPAGRGLRDRHGHWPSICYWGFIVALSGAVAAWLTTGHGG
jgi:hypothetical protein